MARLRLRLGSGKTPFSQAGHHVTWHVRTRVASWIVKDVENYGYLKRQCLPLNRQHGHADKHVGVHP